MARLPPFLAEDSQHEFLPYFPYTGGDVNPPLGNNGDLRGVNEAACFFGSTNVLDVAPIEPASPADGTDPGKRHGIVAVNRHGCFAPHGHGGDAGRYEQARDVLEKIQKGGESKGVVGELFIGVAKLEADHFAEE